MALIWWLSDQPVLPRPGRRVGISDDLFSYTAHAFEYGILAWLAIRALGSSPRILAGLVVAAQRRSSGSEVSRLVASFGAALFSALYAITDEVHQIFVPGRTCKASDWLVDIGGALVAIGLVRLWNNRIACTGSGELSDP
jgi:hypothetical protein